MTVLLRETRDRGAPPRSGLSHERLGDRLFRLVSAAMGVLLLALMAAIAVFLVWEAIPALRHDSANFLTERNWSTGTTPMRFGVAALAFGTVVTSIIALILATPVAIGVALFVSHYAPRKVAAPCGYLVDLLAAVPSIVYGLWGLVFLIPRVQPAWQWIHDHLGFVPIFGGGAVSGKSILTGSVVLAIMILPTIAAVSREVFGQVPIAHQEAALGLGATKWEMIRLTVLPFGRPGVVSATMLGLGRALGETIAVAMLLPANFVVSGHILGPNGNSIAANIANEFGEANGLGRGALIASGLVLFLITLAVNMAARAILSRRKEYARA